MSSPTPYTISSAAAQEQSSACRELLRALHADKDAALESLLRSVAECRRDFPCDPRVIVHLSLPNDNEIPVPTLSVRTSPNEGWAGSRIRFSVGGQPPSRTGHLIVLNLAARIPSGFSRDEFIDGVRRHEIYHVLQSLSGRSIELLAPVDLARCGGIPETLSSLAFQGALPRNEAHATAERWLVQQVRNELEAWNAVDYPMARNAASEGRLDMEHWRAEALCILVRDLLPPMGACFVDAYTMDWHELVASVKHRLETIAAGTFLEQPVRLRGMELTIASCLDSVHMGGGLIRNGGLVLDAFVQLILRLPGRVGQVGIYEPRNANARKFLADHPIAAPTLVNLEVGTNEILTHWSGNAPGTYEGKLEVIPPIGDSLHSTWRATFRRQREIVRLSLPQYMRLDQTGKFRVRIHAGGELAGEIGFEVAPLYDLP